jgi:ribosomal protein S12 methylthiotransferase
MLGLLAKDRCEITPDQAEADLLIVNTCGFIDKARQESVDTILEMAAHKKNGRCKGLIVTGCLVQKHADALMEEVPEIDAFLGSADYPKIAGVARKLLSRRGGEPLKEVHSPVYLYDETTPRLLSTPSYMAYLKIAEGCDHRCGFCAIPSLRGKMRSRTVESCVAEARNLAAAGVKEINVISQDTSEYGRDLYGEPRLGQLLEGLATVEGLRWIRLHYLFPAFLDDALLDTWAAHPKIVRYVDLPLQHGHDAMLKAMRRPGSRESNLRLLERLRKKLPGAALRSSFVVGYPGETEEHFESLLAFLKEAGLDRAGFFTYSREEGTYGGGLPDQVPARIKERRRQKGMKLAAALSEERLKARRGTEVEVLVEKSSAGDSANGISDSWEHGESGGASQDYRPGRFEHGQAPCSGRTALDAPDIDGKVYFSPRSGRRPKPGDFVTVRVESSDEHDLFGRQV